MYFLHIFPHQTSQIASMCFMFQNKKSMSKIKQKSMFHLFSSPLPITLHLYHVQSCPMYNLLYTICQKIPYEKQFKSYLVIPLIPLTLTFINLWISSSKFLKCKAHKM